MAIRLLALAAVLTVGCGVHRCKGCEDCWQRRPPMQASLTVDDLVCKR